jgi:hypothetical protein
MHLHRADIGALQREQLRAYPDSVKIEMTPALRAEILALSRSPPATDRLEKPCRRSKGCSARRPVRRERRARLRQALTGLRFFPLSPLARGARRQRFDPGPHLGRFAPARLELDPYAPVLDRFLHRGELGLRLGGDLLVERGGAFRRRLQRALSPARLSCPTRRRSDSNRAPALRELCQRARFASTSRSPGIRGRRSPPP